MTHACTPGAAQLTLALEPTPQELREEMHRIWRGRAFWRLRYRTLDALLADPWRERLLTVCARNALKARARQQHRHRAAAGPG